MDNKSTLSRRAFLAGAATCAAAAPALLHSAVHTPFRQTLLHVATRVSHSGYVHTFLLASDGCTLLGSTRIDSFAAFGVHPVLPILYVARDCREWEALPRGVIETYVVARNIESVATCCTDTNGSLRNWSALNWRIAVRPAIARFGIHWGSVECFRSRSRGYSCSRCNHSERDRHHAGVGYCLNANSARPRLFASWPARARYRSGHGVHDPAAAFV